MSRRADKIGLRFNRLIVVSRSHNKNKNVFYNVKCDCGKELIVPSSNLRTGNTQSCGCLRIEYFQRGNLS